MHSSPDEAVDFLLGNRKITKYYSNIIQNALKQLSTIIWYQVTEI